MLVERLADAWGQQIKYGQPPHEPDAPAASARSRGALVGILPSLSELIDRAEAMEAGVVDFGLRFGSGLEKVQDEMTVGKQHLGEALARMLALPL